MTIGHVYVAVSDSFPGDCKVGFTLRSVSERMAELQRQYRTRHPFRAYDHLMVKNPRRVEWWAHQRLASYRKPGTELFECAAENGKAALLWAVDRVIEEERKNPYVMQPRPQRAPERRRRTRQPASCALLATAISAAMAACLVVFRPSLPGWLPEPVRNTAAMIEALASE